MRKKFEENAVINFVGISKLAFAISLILLLTSFAAFFINGFNLGIDFKGGLLIEARGSKPINLAEARSAISKAINEDFSLSNFSGSDSDILIKLGYAKGSKADSNKIVDLLKQTIAEKIDKNIEFRRVDYVGPQVSGELMRSSVMAISFAFLAIMAYLSFRFQFKYGIGAILALLHDIIVTLGFISMFELEFNLTSIGAILIIIGYSVNDSVVIYDRIRETLRKYKKADFAEVINMSISATLSRTILTVVTTLLAVFSLIFFGGETIRGFSIIIFVGILIGTYSSILIAAPLLRKL